ncbi:MAG: IPExxxVDY family protein [Chitinophagaceae bacterium]|nr:MAG: IPExxxVDY family protein [Chitinophagaceae bacterium]
MPVTKLHLAPLKNTDSFFHNSTLIGIISRMKPYKLCWEINRILNFNFIMNHELEITLLKKEKKCFFPVYEYAESLRFTTHYLYNNHYKGEFLLPELKHTDFLWMIKGDYYNEEEVKYLMDAIKKIPAIQLATILDVEDLKNKDNLIL